MREREPVLAIDETLKAADRQIAQHGWYGVKVREQETHPGWEHSIGFGERLGQPEIIVFGLDYEISHGLIWAVYHRLRAGADYGDGTIASGIIEGLECQFRTVMPVYFDDYLPAARLRHDRRGSVHPFRALQLIWPDESGRFPWEDGSDPDFAGHQPLLFDLTAPVPA